MMVEILFGSLCLFVAFLVFLILTFLSLRRVNQIRDKGLKTLREIKRGLAAHEGNR